MSCCNDEAPEMRQGPWGFDGDEYAWRDSNTSSDTLEKPQHLSGALQKALQFYPDLAQVVNVWAALPAEIRRAIVAMVEAAGKKE